MLAGELLKTVRIGNQVLSGLMRREASGGIAHRLTLPGGFDGSIINDPPGEYQIGCTNADQFAVGQYLGLGYPYAAPVSWCGGLVITEIVGNTITCDATDAYGDALPSDATEVLIIRQVPIVLPAAISIEIRMGCFLADLAARLDGGDGCPFGDWEPLMLAAGEPFNFAYGDGWEKTDMGKFWLAWAQGEVDVDLHLAFLYESVV